MRNSHDLFDRNEGEQARFNRIISLTAELSAVCREALDILAFAQYCPDVMELTAQLGCHRAQSLGCVDKITSSLLEPFSLSASAQNENYSLFLDPVCGFRMQLIDDIIIAAMPTLLPRSYSHKIVAEEYGHAYAASLSYVMSRFVDSTPPQQIKKYVQKTVSLIFVFPDDDQIPDADGFDTKSVIDAVTGHLPGGDSGQYCSFYFRSTLIPNIKGTYILISPGLDSVPTADLQRKYILSVENGKNHR